MVSLANRTGPMPCSRGNARSVAKIVHLDDALFGGWWVGCIHYMNRRTSEADTLLAAPYQGRW